MMRRRSVLFFVSMLVITVFLFSTVNVFAVETTQDVLDESIDNGDSGDSGNFIKRRVGRSWKGKGEVDLEKLKEKKQERFEFILSDLVDEGIITQDKSDEIFKQYEEFVATIESRKEERKPMLEQVVEEGILTQEEADTVKEALTEGRYMKTRVRMSHDEDRGEVLNQRLSELVDEGVLTQDKVDNIVEFFEDKISERQELKESGGFWGQMVDDGIITEEEAEEIKEYCGEKINGNCRRHCMPRFKFKKGLRNSEDQ